MKKRKNGSAPIKVWAEERLGRDVRQSLDRLSRTEDVRTIAVMPDVHLAREICVGVAFATRELLFPDAVGGDIGCGMSAVALDTSIEDGELQAIAPSLLRAIRSGVPIQRHRADAIDRARRQRLPDPGQLTSPDLQALAANIGVAQLGTLGAGNHFLELQHDIDDRRLWLMVHSGSRGMGQAIRAHHVKFAHRTSTGLSALRADAPEGQAYVDDVAWARRYASASRRAMLDAASEHLSRLIGCELVDGSYIDVDHNHLRQETYAGSVLIVHRKGAMPAFDGQLGVVPGSMASPSFHVRGRGVDEALRSSAHGAGRAMSRSEARRRIKPNDLERQLQSVHFDRKSLAGLISEAPAAYKNIRNVMRSQRKLVRIVRTLAPILTYKGSGRERETRRR